MCCEQLICASCASPVAEARCPVCRTARAGLHGSSPALPAPAILVLAVLVLVLLTLAAHGRLH